MTGAEHYRQAERLLLNVRMGSEEMDPGSVEHTLRAAQVHATLALAAAEVWGRVGLPSINGDQHGYGL